MIASRGLIANPSPPPSSRSTQTQRSTSSLRPRDYCSKEPLPDLWTWKRIPRLKRLLLIAFFLAAFLVLDGSSTAAHKWEGAPPWYLPVGLSLALMLSAGSWSLPVVFLCSLIAAVINYHCPIFSWCGIPGATAVYFGYAASAIVLKGRWRADLRRGTLSDVGRYLVACLGGSVGSTLAGVLSVLADGKIQVSQIPTTAAEWWTSDALAIVAFAPFLIVYGAPVIADWLAGSKGTREPEPALPSTLELLELAGQLGLVAFALWFVFAYAPSIPYQPLYLLFIPVIWVSVRRGLPGAVLVTFTIGVGMTFAAWLRHPQLGSLPRLQFAMLALGLTGLCLGAVVSDRERGERSIRDSEKRYRLLFERNLAGVFRTTVDGHFLECNPAAALLFGYNSPEEIIGLPVIHLYTSSDDRVTLLERLTREKYIANHEMEFRRKNGDPVWAMLNVMLAETDPAGGGILEGTIVDITKRKLAEQRAQSLAFYDALTSLPNRVLMRDRLSQALGAARRSGQRVALLFLDLDRFKTINDSLGHSVGDLLLQETAGRLKACTREQDTVARLGGDEFLLILTGVNSVHDVAVATERIMDAMLAEFLIQRHALRVGCSIGISVFPDHGADTETLIKYADAAMYSAKERGRNNYQFFTADMNRKAVERLRIENALRLALERDELFLVYQPQVEIATGDTIGLEALLRWRHPEMGLIPPDRFIPVAETSGLIFSIGEWVLNTACRQTRKWQEEGRATVPVAVNVSAVQFRHDGFCNRVKSILSETGLAPTYLELELTETFLLADAERTLSVLRELNRMGLSLTIDDFGTGYSSLGYLRRFPVSKLKIDRSFIREIAVNSDDDAITAAIIRMGRSLNLRVVAEGVETEAQMSFLRTHECSAVQGYYISRPLSVEDLAEKFLSRAASAARP